MSVRSTQQAAFTAERTYDASPARVFAAFAMREAKSRWFGGPDDREDEQLDFRVGGREFYNSRVPRGPVYSMKALYHDIVPDQRILSTYEMYMDEARISVSVLTVELHAAGAGTQLILTEQGVFLDGHDKPEYREKRDE